MMCQGMEKMENEPKEAQSKYPPPPECEQFVNRVET